MPLGYAEVLDVDLEAPPPPPSQASEEEQGFCAQLLERFDEDASEMETFPAAALEVLRLVAEPELRTSVLMRTVQQDPGLSWALLRVANSAAYQALSEVSTLKTAVARLGTREVGRVAGMVAARALFHPRTRAQQATFRERRARLYQRSLVVAQVASALALDAPAGQPDRAYLGGLLHCIGRALALRALAALAVDGRWPLGEGDPRIERLLALVQADLASAALRRWSLPEFVRNLTAFESELGLPGEPEWVDLHAVRVPASLWALRHEPASAPRAPWVAVESARALGLSPQRVRTVERELADAARRTERSLQALALS